MYLLKYENNANDVFSNMFRKYRSAWMPIRSEKCTFVSEGKSNTYLAQFFNCRVPNEARYNILNKKCIKRYENVDRGSD